MTLDEADNAMLAEVDSKWTKLRLILGDRKFCNPDWSEYKDAVTQFHEAVQALILFRDARGTVEHTVADQQRTRP